MSVAVEASICGFAPTSGNASVGHPARKRSHEADADHIPERPPSVVRYAHHEGIAGLTLRHRTRRKRRHSASCRPRRDVFGI